MAAMKSEIEGAKGLWHIRLLLASLGWRSELNIGNYRRGGPAHARIYFDRYDWHGFRADDVKVGDVIGIDLGDPNGTSQAVLERARGLALACLDAWERFDNEVPVRLPDGSWTVNERATEYRNSPGTRRRMDPTENLPEDVSKLCLPAAQEDRILTQILRLSPWQCQYGDRLGWSLAAGERHLPAVQASCKGRVWDLTFRAPPTVWHGVDLGYPRHPEKFEMPPDEATVCRAVADHADRLEALALDYPAGAGLPPGMETVGQKIWREAEDFVRGLMRDARRDPCPVMSDQTNLLESWILHLGDSIGRYGLTPPTMEDIRLLSAEVGAEFEDGATDRGPGLS